MLGQLVRRRPAPAQRLLARSLGASTSTPSTSYGSKYAPAVGAFVAPARQDWDAIVVGGGHNGLVAAAYLAKAGARVLVLERRHLLGGAAVTEELPKTKAKISRASYLAGLLRPQIITELGLERHGFKYLVRDPSSFTPTGRGDGRHLILGSDEEANWRSVAQFSARDADTLPLYESFLGQVREIVEPLLDGAPPNPFAGSWRDRRKALTTLKTMVRACPMHDGRFCFPFRPNQSPTDTAEFTRKTCTHPHPPARQVSVGAKHRAALVPFYELFTAPAAHILDRWFESDVLKATLATDAVIGASGWW